MQGSVPELDDSSSLGPSAHASAESSSSSLHSHSLASSRVRTASGGDASALGKSSLHSFTKMSLDEYVRAKGGNRVISKILIANNGIAAVKAIRSMRRWAYETFGTDRILEFVVMATPEDLKANAAYIHLADEVAPVPGGSNNNNYANIRLIVDIAERTGVQAVWPGWGHASENDRLPELLAQTKNKIVWIGPPPEAMRALGDKIGSTLIAQSAGVPCMGWSGSGLTVNYKKHGIPKDLYESACVRTTAEAVASAQRIGFPIMIKASEGGGGKGIRKVESIEDVELAFPQVQGEVPGSPIFLMKLAPTCRHLEVQLLADRFHSALAVFGRDCSIQRRHQKIIEEGPVVAAPPDVWRHMEQSAVRLAKEVGYVGAGTVEYLYCDDGSYYFLELNPRLQVEHPVTELISGVNLPAAQLQIAMGIPLHNVRGIRRMYGEHPDTDSPIDFDTRQARTLPGHVIACRITAENPDSQFQPTSGSIQELNFRATPDVWGYFSVSARGGIHEYSDSQFGHMFALGETREIARRNMVLAIKELSIRGDIRTTVEYLRQILETEDFRTNNLSTTWLEKLMAKRAVMTEKPPLHQTVLLGALWRTYKAQASKTAEFMAMLERGQLPPPSLHQDLIHQRAELIYEKVKYVFAIDKTSPSSYELTLNGSVFRVDIHTLTDEGLLCILNGKKHVVYGQEFPSGLRLVIDGKTCLFHEEYDPTQLRSSMPGKLVRFLVPEGAHVSKDKPYAEIEVMKMYISLTAPEDGLLRHAKPEGSIIEAGDLLATLSLDHPERVQKAELFTGQFAGGESVASVAPAGALVAASSTPAAGDASAYKNNHVNLTLKDAHRRLVMLLQGYSVSTGSMQRSVEELMNCLRAPILPLEQFREALSSITSRIPSSLVSALQSILDGYAGSVAHHRFSWESPEDFPVIDLQNAIDAALNALPSDEERTKLQTSLQSAGVSPLLQLYKDGNHGYAVHVLQGLWEEFVSVESHFVDASGDTEKTAPEFVIKALRKRNKDDLETVARVARAHHQLAKRNELVVLLLDIIQKQLSPLLSNFLPIVRRLAALNTRDCGNVVLKARQLIMATELPSNVQRRIAIQTLLNTASAAASAEQRRDRLAPLIDQSQPIEDLIFSFLAPECRPAVQTSALEAYIRRIYQVYSVPFLDCQAVKPLMTASPHPVTPGAKPIMEEAGPTLIARWHFNMDPWSARLEQESRQNAKLALSSASSPSSASAQWQQQPVVNKVAQAGGESPVLVSSTLASSSSAAAPSGRLLQKSDSVIDIGKLRAPKSARGTGTGADAVEEDEVEYGSDEDKKGDTVPAGRVAEASERSTGTSPSTAVPVRQGVWGYFSSFDAMKRGFAQLLPLFDTRVKFVEPVHVLYVALRWGNPMAQSSRLPPDDNLSAYLRTFVASKEKDMAAAGVRRVTFIISSAASASASTGGASGTAGASSQVSSDYPAFFTFRARLGYDEDTLVRHIEPITAAQLDLERLSNFDLAHITTTNRSIHLFAAYPAKETGKGVALHGATAAVRLGAAAGSNQPTASTTAYDGRRFFIRTLVRKLDGSTLFTGGASSGAGFPTRPTSPGSYTDAELDAYPETEFAFVEALNALEIAMHGDASRSPFKLNSIFLNVLVEAAIDATYVEAVIRLMARRYASKIKRLYVSVVEFTICIKPAAEGDAAALRASLPAGATITNNGGAIAYRFIATNPTGYNLLVDSYIEVKDPATGRIYFKLVNKQAQHGRSMVYGAMTAVAGGASSACNALTSSVSWDGVEVSTPYAVSVPFQKQRQVAASMETIYAYDFVPLLEHAISKQWRARYTAHKYAAATAGRRRPSMSVANSLLLQLQQQAGLDVADAAHTSLPERESAYRELKSDEEASLSSFLPRTLLKAVELVLSVDPQTKQATLVESDRAPGNNTIGMVAWLLTLFTPELAGSSGAAGGANLTEGRQVVLIANDITFQAGTFGPQEDLLFDLASKFARARGLPRWYFAANSGARIGLAEELRGKFHVAFVEDNPLKGFQYLYLRAEDYPSLAKSVVAEEVRSDKGEVRYAIRDIIGARDGLGVENLRGSGTIAGETSRAYEDIYTLTYVTSRTVGIGAYLARLGQRVIQKNSLPIILTGYSALNKLLGKQVYTSNVQLGGPDIMFTNGVSHLTVNDDMEGVIACLNWLAYVPVVRHAPLPVLLPPFKDPVNRLVEFTPTKAPYDPRHLLAGHSEAVLTGAGSVDASSVWRSGLLDRDSWTELLGGWARTAVVGRGRIGGLPLGIIAVETRTVEQVVPADPAAPDSKEVIQQRAGQVWYPDSSFKTAQGIRDCIAEDLPVLVLANWRGFSGGQKDMFEEVLKFGAYIVDALRDVQQPVIVYLPPHATLRGGAWVVVDQTINEQYMEMYADPTARGGVLETEGTLDVKYRKKDVLATAHRLDEKLQALDKELAEVEKAAAGGEGVSSPAPARSKEAILKDIRARETLIFPSFHQVATQFADLHDTPGRMQAKGCIQGSVPWAQARQFIYSRLLRRMRECRWVKRIEAVLAETAPRVSAGASAPEHWRKAQALLNEWVRAAAGGDADKVLSDDAAWSSWFAAAGHESKIDASFAAFKRERLVGRMKALLTADASGSDAGVVAGLAGLIDALSPEQRAALKKIF